MRNRQRKRLGQVQTETPAELRRHKIVGDVVIAGDRQRSRPHRRLRPVAGLFPTKILFVATEGEGQLLHLPIIALEPRAQKALHPTNRHRKTLVVVIDYNFGEKILGVVDHPHIRFRITLEDFLRNAQRSDDRSLVFGEEWLDHHPKGPREKYH